MSERISFENTKRGINSLVIQPKLQTKLPKEEIRPPIAESVTTTRKSTDDESSGTLEGPLTHTVTSTKTITIPVPAGANKVDVEVMKSYKLTDANGNVYPVTVDNYPA